jgi:hypothetical protein
LITDTQSTHIAGKSKNCCGVAILAKPSHAAYVCKAIADNLVIKPGTHTPYWRIAPYTDRKG